MQDYIYHIIEKVAAQLTVEERSKLTDDVFGLPNKRKFPMPDEEHTIMAWRFLNKAKISEAERQQAKKRILSRAEELGIDTSGWKTAGEFLQALDKLS